MWDRDKLWSARIVPGPVMVIATRCRVLVQQQKGLERERSRQGGVEVLNLGSDSATLVAGLKFLRFSCHFKRKHIHCKKHPFASCVHPRYRLHCRFIHRFAKAVNN